MSDLVPYADHEAVVSLSTRRTARSMSRSQAIAQLRIGRVADDSAVAGEKIDQLTMTTAGGLMAIARLHGVRHQLEQLSPDLSGAFERLCALHELTVAQEIEDLRRDLRRR